MKTLTKKEIEVILQAIAYSVVVMPSGNEYLVREIPESIEIKVNN